MKKHLMFFVVLAICIIMSLSAAADNDSSLRIMSLNVLNSTDKEARFDAIKATVSELSPDIFGFQECREGFNSLLTEIKTFGYESVASALIDDPDDNTIINCVPIFYNTDRFSLVEGSEGARRFVEKYADSWTKSLCYCVLEEKAISQRYIIINVHFAVYSDSYGLTSSEVFAQRDSNAREVIAQIKTMQNEYGELPVIVFGDFNMDEPESAYRILTGALTDAALVGADTAPYMATYHGDLADGETGGYPIDHIFVSSNDFAVAVCKPYTSENGKAASDHYPIYADLMLKEGSGETCAEAHTSDSPLVILDATRRTPFSDTLEAFTVMNVSDEAVDLSHILAWYGVASTEGELDALEASSVTEVMRLAPMRGETVLEPGEKAVIWCITSTAYKTTVTTNAGEVSLVEKGEDGSPVYRTDVFRDAVENLASNGTYSVKPLDDNTVIVPLDRTTRDVFGADGSYRHLPLSFNLQNSVYIRLYLTYDTALDASEAFCTADLDGTGDGTYLDGSGAVKVKFGTYKYLPSGEVWFKPNTYIYGCPTVYELLCALEDYLNDRVDTVWDMNGDGILNMVDIIRIVKAMVV